MYQEEELGSEVARLQKAVEEKTEQIEELQVNLKRADTCAAKYFKQRRTALNELENLRRHHDEVVHKSDNEIKRLAGLATLHAQLANHHEQQANYHEQRAERYKANYQQAEKSSRALRQRLSLLEPAGGQLAALQRSAATLRLSWPTPPQPVSAAAAPSTASPVPLCPAASAEQPPSPAEVAAGGARLGALGLLPVAPWAAAPAQAGPSGSATQPLPPVYPATSALPTRSRLAGQTSASTDAAAAAPGHSNALNVPSPERIAAQQDNSYSRSFAPQAGLPEGPPGLEHGELMRLDSTLSQCTSARTQSNLDLGPQAWQPADGTRGSGAGNVDQAEQLSQLAARFSPKTLQVR